MKQIIITSLFVLLASQSAKSQSTKPNYWTFQGSIELANALNTSDKLFSGEPELNVGLNYHHYILPQKVMLSYGMLVSVRNFTSETPASPEQLMDQQHSGYSLYLTLPVVMEFELEKWGFTVGPKLGFNVLSQERSELNIQGDSNSSQSMTYEDDLQVGFIVGAYWRTKKDHRIGVRYQADVARFPASSADSRMHMLGLYFQARL